MHGSRSGGVDRLEYAGLKPGRHSQSQFFAFDQARLIELARKQYGLLNFLHREPGQDAPHAIDRARPVITGTHKERKRPAVDAVLASVKRSVQENSSSAWW